MGNVSLSCHGDAEKVDLLQAIRAGDLARVKLSLDSRPKLVRSSLSPQYSRVHPLHYAASYGQTEILLFLLESGAPVNALSHRKQTPLMLGCKNGRLSCTEHLLHNGADMLVFDARNGRTCLHYAAKSGHLDCLNCILTAAKLPAVSQSWGFAQFVNVRDENGATPLHLAARFCHSAVVRTLLSNGALVCATTTMSGRSGPGFGSTPLHFAARGGSTECIKELLAWGADRTRKNSQGHTPFLLALKYRNRACAALLNPLTAEPVVWPSPWKFMSNLDPEAKVLLETALAQANDAWERKILSGDSKTSGNDVDHMLGGVSEDDDDDDDDEKNELCYICFDHTCTIEVQECGHQMCAKCTLSLCCHTKPNPTMPTSPAPVCPFCRCNIGQLRSACSKQNKKPAVVEDKTEDTILCKLSSGSKSKRHGEGNSSSSSSFMGLVSKGSFRLLSSAKSSSRVMDIDTENLQQEVSII